MNTPEALPRLNVSFVRSRDRTRIAVASLGCGAPVLRAAHWLSHVSFDLESPVWRHWLDFMSREHRYVRYDLRGCGLSDRAPAEINFDTWLEDLEAVADTIAEPFTLVGMSQGGALSIAYALRHPRRVARLVLIGAYGQGLLARASSEEDRLEAQTLLNLIRLGWGREVPAFNQVFTNLFIPGGTPEHHKWWQELERNTASPDVAARTMKVLHEIDVIDMARQLEVPAIVFHSRGDARIPFDEGLKLAAAIPGARFVPLDSGNHVLLDDEPAWKVFQAEMDAFLPGGSSTKSDRIGHDLTPAEGAVLELVAQGLGNAEIAERLSKSEKTVRNQVSVVLDKLGVRTRSEAIVRVLGGDKGRTSQH